MNIHIYPRGDGWGLREHAAGQTKAFYRRLSEAKREAKRAVQQDGGVIYLHREDGTVLTRTEVKERPAASLWIEGAAKMSLARRKVLAAWLRRRAVDLLKNGDQYAYLFRARCYK